MLCLLWYIYRCAAGLQEILCEDSVHLLCETQLSQQPLAGIWHVYV